MWLWLATATVDDHLPTTPLPIEWCHRSLPCQIDTEPPPTISYGLMGNELAEAASSGGSLSYKKSCAQQGRSFLILPFRPWKNPGVGATAPPR